MASLVFLAFVSLAIFSCSCQADLISDVCSKASNPTLCNQILRSDPRSAGADLKGLGQIAIDKSKSEVQNSISLANSVKNDGNKEIIDTCIETFGDSIDDLNECSQLLKIFNRGILTKLQTTASAALTDAGTCDDEFGDDEPPKLKEATSKAEDSIDVLLAICNSF